jgi:hypothetical protein
MIIKENIIDKNYHRYIPNHLETLFSSNFIILDIETTGFSREKSSIILIGLLIKSDTQLISKQIFAETLEEERNILLELIDLIKSKDDYFFITYNGHSFDLPFINSKLKQHTIDYQLNLDNNFDLYRLIRKNKDVLNLKRYNLKTIEKFLGINRSDTISGKESIQLYFDYLETNAQGILEKILLHNFEDIKYLIPLLEILKYFSYNQIMHFYPKKIGNDYYLNDLNFHNNFLKITLSRNNKLHVNYFDEFCTIKSEKNNLIIKIALKEFLINNIKYHLINHKIFYEETFDNLQPKIKNNLIVLIQNEVQFDKLLLNIEEILEKYNIKKVSMDYSS